MEELKSNIPSSGSRTSSLRTPFKDWLVKQDAPWLIVFDNAYDGFDFSGLYPPGKGKIIITSRPKPGVADSLTTSLRVGPLAPSEACSIFIEAWRHQRRGISVPHPPSVLPDSALASFEGRPLAIVLAATQLALTCQDWNLTLSQLRDLVDETAPEPGDLDPLIWKWVWLMLEELTPSESQFLALLVVLDSTIIPIQLLDSINYRLFLPRMTKFGLIHTHMHLSKPYLFVPLAIRNCLYQFLQLQSNEFHRSIIREATNLLDAVVTSCKVNDYASRKVLEMTHPRFRQVCLCTKRFGLSPDRTMTDLAQTLSACALGGASSRLIDCCHTHFWKTWLVNNEFGFPDHIPTDEDESQFIEPPILPSWITPEPVTSSESAKHLHSFVFELLADFYQDDLTKCLLMGAIGHCWHGIREEIFGFVKELPNAPQDQSRLELFNDAIEQGAANDGLVSAARDVYQTLTKDQQFSTEGKRRTMQAVSIIVACLEDFYQEEDVDDEHLRSAISAALKPYHLRGCGVIGQAFLGTFRGTVTAFLCSVLESAFPRGSAPSLESLKSSAAFIVGECSTTELEKRSRKIAKGYWEVNEAMSIFIATDILCKFSASLPEAQSHRKEHLLKGTMELIRDGIIQLEHKRTQLWRSTLRQAAFRCELAQQCLTMWGADSTERKYSDQERWTENCIYLEVDGANQPVDWLV
jgi:hypothetical protein